jgi:hypothetical protein
MSIISPEEADEFVRLKAEVEQLRADLELRNQTACDRKEIIARLECDLTEAAAFLDRMAARLDAMLDVGATHDTGIAPDIDRAGDECRAMADKIRASH